MFKRCGFIGCLELLLVIYLVVKGEYETVWVGMLNVVWLPLSDLREKSKIVRKGGMLKVSSKVMLVKFFKLKMIRYNEEGMRRLLCERDAISLRSWRGDKSVLETIKGMSRENLRSWVLGFISVEGNITCKGVKIAQMFRNRALIRLLVDVIGFGEVGVSGDLLKGQLVYIYKVRLGMMEDFVDWVMKHSDGLGMLDFNKRSRELLALGIGRVRLVCSFWESVGVLAGDLSAACEKAGVGLYLGMAYRGEKSLETLGLVSRNLLESRLIAPRLVIKKAFTEIRIAMRDKNELAEFYNRYKDTLLGAKSVELKVLSSVILGEVDRKDLAEFYGIIEELRFVEKKKVTEEMLEERRKAIILIRISDIMNDLTILDRPLGRVDLEICSDILTGKIRSETIDEYLLTGRTVYHKELGLGKYRRYIG